MRTELPQTFAELTFVSINDGEMVETTERVLIESMNEVEVQYINLTGANLYASTYTDYVDERKRVAGIKFLSNDDDAYMEFVQSVQFGDMTKAIEELGSYVEKEFQKIISVCPEDNKTLWEQLKIHIIPEE